MQLSNTSRARYVHARATHCIMLHSQQAVRWQRSCTHPQQHCCSRHNTSAVARTRHAGWCLQAVNLVSCVTHALPELAPALAKPPGLEHMRTSPARLLLPKFRRERFGQAVASSFGSVPVMELLPIAKARMLLRLAHAAMGSVPVRQHSPLRWGRSGGRMVSSAHTICLCMLCLDTHFIQWYT